MKKLAGALVPLALLLSSCGKDEQKPAPPAKESTPGGARPEKTASGEPAVITVEHILIGVKGGRATSAKREKDEAARFAFELLRRARDGEDFIKLRDEFTEDPGKGPYTMTNRGIPAERAFPGQPPREYDRETMAKAFGDVGFSLEVGQIGVTDYEPATSPFGYHIIKRVK